MLGPVAVSTVLLGVTSLWGPPPVSAVNSSPAPPSPATLELHRSVTVVDAHADTVQEILYGGGDFFAGIPQGHIDWPRFEESGIDAQLFSIFVRPARNAAVDPTVDPTVEAGRQIAALRDLAGRSRGRLAIARTTRDVRDNEARGVRSILFGIEGAHTLGRGSEERRLGQLRRFAADGIRYLTLTWTVSNAYGGSSSDGGDSTGLTPEGRRLIDEMGRLGIVVDLSHASDPLFWDAIRHARKPVLLSHSSARALANVPRNATDAMLRAVAKNGGAACVNFNPAFLDESYARAQKPIWAKWENSPISEMWPRVREDSARLPPVPLSRLADHVIHMVAIAGEDHVCLGSDFDGVPSLPAGLEHAGKLPWLTEELRRRGISPSALAKVLGGNLLRVLEANDPSPRR